MPSPINHRDITLTETGRGGKLKHTHDVRVHLDTVRITGATGALPFTDNSVSPDDLTRHELRIFSGSTLKAKIFWDVECIYGGPDTPGRGVNQYRDPYTQGAVNGTRPSSADPFDKILDGGWSVHVYAWNVPSGWTITQARTNAPDGATWTITVKSGATVKYLGALAITWNTQSFLDLTRLTEIEKEKLFATGLIRREDLLPGPTPDATKKTKQTKQTKKT